MSLTFETRLQEISGQKYSLREERDIRASYETGIRKAGDFLMFLDGKMPGNTEGSQGLQFAFRVNYPNEPQGSTAHIGFLDAMGFGDIEYIDSIAEPVFTSPLGCILRQVITIDDLPGNAAFVSYWAQRNQTDASLAAAA
ncbi:MAG TPA: hypothetical protein VM124_00080 [Candidatus Limnocylindrales bacterium]|nr:hypothetical protein [Candidatus Limnocylindrales bacterium]